MTVSTLTNPPPAESVRARVSGTVPKVAGLINLSSEYEETENGLAAGNGAKL